MSLEANLRGVHPILAFRIRRLLSEPSLSRYSIYPAVRDRAKQEALYAKYKAGKETSLRTQIARCVPPSVPLRLDAEGVVAHGARRWVRPRR